MFFPSGFRSYSFVDEIDISIPVEVSGLSVEQSHDILNQHTPLIAKITLKSFSRQFFDPPSMAYLFLPVFDTLQIRLSNWLYRVLLLPKREEWIALIRSEVVEDLINFLDGEIGVLWLEGLMEDGYLLGVVALAEPVLGVS